MRKIRKIVFAVFCAVLCAGILCGCSKPGDFHVNKKTVCTVDGQKITYDEYKYFFYTHMMDISYTEDVDFSTGESFERLKSMTEESLKRRAVIMSLVDEYNIKMDEEDTEIIDNYIESQISEQGGKEQYRDWLLSNRLTGDIFRSQVELTFFYDPYLRELLMTGIDNHIVMNDEAIYNDVKENFYRYTQIFFELDAGENSLDLKASADEAYARLRAGEDFYEIAKEYSEWMADAEKGVYVAKGEKEVLLENAVLDLEEGEYSEIVESSEGYHIFLRLGMDDEYIADNIDIFEDQSFARRYNQFIADESKKVELVYTDYFGELDFDVLTRKETI